MVFKSLENGLMIGLKMEAFLSQLDIIRLSEESFALAKTCVFNLHKHPLLWRTQKCSRTLSAPSLHRTSFFALANSFAEVKVVLHLGELKTSILHSSTLQRRSFFFPLANCFTVAKVFLCLGEAMLQALGYVILTFCPFVA